MYKHTRRKHLLNGVRLTLSLYIYRLTYRRRADGNGSCIRRLGDIAFAQLFRCRMRFGIGRRSIGCCRGRRDRDWLFPRSGCYYVLAVGGRHISYRLFTLCLCQQTFAHRHQRDPLHCCFRCFRSDRLRHWSTRNAARSI